MRNISTQNIGNTTITRQYWNEFYKNTRPSGESTFCHFVKKMIDNSAIILDVGCGSGRDSFSFVEDGYEVFGIDASEEVIKSNLSIKEIYYNNSRIDFQILDLNDRIALRELVKRLSNKAQVEKREIVVYLRFLLHSIPEETEQILLDVISEHIPQGSYFAAEFRTIEDEKRKKVFEDHYRRFIDAEALLRNLEEKYNFNKIYFTQGTGLSIYQGEDPFLARIIMKKG